MTSRPPDAPSDEPADDQAVVLDADLCERLATAIDAEPLPAAVQARIKQRLLRRIAAASTPLHLTQQPGPREWQDFGDGLRIKVLHEADGVMSYLIRLAPGASLPAHRHPIDEECVVLEGAVQIGELSVAAGGFHLGRRGVLHDSLSSSEGAVIFLRGAVPEAALAL